MQIDKTILFNLTTGKRTVVRRLQGESNDEHRPRVLCQNLQPGDHYVAFEIPKRAAPSPWEAERVRMADTADGYVVDGEVILESWLNLPGAPTKWKLSRGWKRAVRC